MSLKYNFAIALLAVCVIIMMLAVMGWLGEDPRLLAALGGVGLIAAAAAWFVDLLDRRMAAMTLALDQLKAQSGPLTLDPAAMPRDGLAQPFDELTGAINRALAELRAGAVQNRAIAEHGPDAMWVFHVEKFQLVDVNENFARLSGYSREQLIGMTPMDVSPPLQAGGVLTRDYAQKLILTALEEGKVNAPWTLRTAEGLEIPCELRAIHLIVPNATLICGSLSDLRDRLEAQQELEHRRQFESLITRVSASLAVANGETMDDAVTSALYEVGAFASVDRSYVFLYNETGLRVRCTHEWCADGVAPQIVRLQGLRVADFPWASERLQRGEVVQVPDVAALPREAEAERREWQAEGIRSLLLVPVGAAPNVRGYVGFDVVGASKAWSASVIALLNVFGEMVINAIERSAAEAKLRESARVLELANAELERSNAELKQFAYIASHDLQEPLRSISGFSALLARRYKGKLDADADEYIHYMTEATARMQRMIRDLLDYSRIDARAKPFQPMALAESLKTALANLQASIIEMKAEVSYDELPEVLGDGAQLVQVWQNLIGNSIKFHGESAPRIHIRAELQGRQWQISLRDNGIGISREDCERIFQIFRRLHAADKYPGTGIGLAACKRIIERHRGRIWAEPNTEGPGTTFCFTLPVLEAAQKPVLEAKAA